MRLLSALSELQPRKLPMMKLLGRSRARRADSAAVSASSAHDPHTKECEHEHRAVAGFLATTIFASCSEAELALVAARCTHVTFDRGEYVLRQGERDDALYFLLSGACRVIKHVDSSVHDLSLIHI